MLWKKKRTSHTVVFNFALLLTVSATKNVYTAQDLEICSGSIFACKLAIPCKGWELLYYNFFNRKFY